LGQIPLIAHDLVLQCLLGQWALQLTHLLLQNAVLGGRYHLPAGTDCRQRAAGEEPPASKTAGSARSRADVRPTTPTCPTHRSLERSSPSRPPTSVAGATPT
jgi:hypothetical protein